MALLKKCKHPRADWSGCGCAWYSVRRIDGRQVYVNLGRDEAEARRRHAIDDAPAGDSFRAWGERWYAVTAHRIRPNTAHNYRYALDRATEVVGDLSLGAISAAVVAEMEASLAAVGLSPGYITNIRIVTMGVLSFAESAGAIPEAPNLRRTPPLARRSDVRHLDPPDMERVLAALEPGYRECATFGWLTGLRPGELLAVEVGDITGAVLRVERQVNTRTGQIAPLKTHRSRRRIDLSPRALAVADEAAALAASASERIERSGTRLWPFSYPSLAHRWRDALDRCGLPRMGLHALRHSNASLRLAAGQDVVYVADQLGHATANVTLRTYAHLIHRPHPAPEVLDELVRQLAPPGAEESRAARGGRRARPPRASGRAGRG